MRFDGWLLLPKPTCGQHDVRRTEIIEAQIAATSQCADSMIGCYQPCTLIVFNSDIQNKKPGY